jgi:hypothetical protein
METETNLHDILTDMIDHMDTLSNLVEKHENMIEKEQTNRYYLTGFWDGFFYASTFVSTMMVGILCAIQLKT